MEETLATEYLQYVEMTLEQWEVLEEYFSASVTLGTLIFIMLCVTCGVLLGQILWRWMK